MQFTYKKNNINLNIWHVNPLMIKNPVEIINKNISKEFGEYPTGCQGSGSLSDNVFPFVMQPVHYFHWAVPYLAFRGHCLNLQMQAAEAGCRKTVQ